jgi:outer membrane lipoprotein-sorting protein
MMQMKKVLFLILSVFMVGGLFAQDLKLEDVLAKHFKAIGQEKFAKVQTMKMTGKVFQMGMEMTMSVIKKRPNLSRTEVDVQGTKIVYAIDGQSGWMIMPFTGSSDPQDMPEEQLASAKKEDMDGPFINYKDKGTQLELVGKEIVDSIQVYNIKVTTKDGESSNFYIDAAKFVIVKMKAKVMSQGQLAEVETKFSDFREVNGMKNAYKIETLANGQAGATITFETVEFDVPVDNAIFAKPAAK